MGICVRRFEAGIGEHSLLQQKFFADWDQAFVFLTDKIGPGVLNSRKEIEAHPDTQFINPMEMVCSGSGGYSSPIAYDIQVVEEMGEDLQVEPLPKTTPAAAELEMMRSRALKESLAPKPKYRCKTCGAVGSGGCYPFSTAPSTGYCDDCL